MAWRLQGRKICANFWGVNFLDRCQKFVQFQSPKTILALLKKFVNKKIKIFYFLFCLTQ
jgi:hypothetical protein